MWLRSRFFNGDLSHWCSRCPPRLNFSLQKNVTFTTHRPFFLSSNLVKQRCWNIALAVYQIRFQCKRNVWKAGPHVSNFLLLYLPAKQFYLCVLHSNEGNGCGWHSESATSPWVPSTTATACIMWRKFGMKLVRAMCKTGVINFFFHETTFELKIGAETRGRHTRLGSWTMLMPCEWKCIIMARL